MLYDKDYTTIKDGDKVLFREMNRKTGKWTELVGTVKYKCENKIGLLEIKYVNGFTRFLDFDFKKTPSLQLADIEVIDERIYKRELLKWTKKLGERD